MKVKEESENIGLKLYVQKTKIMASGPITSWQIDGKQWKQWLTLFCGALQSPRWGGGSASLQMVTAAMKLKDAYSLEGKLWPTSTAYYKAKTILCQQRPIYSRLWFFQWSCMDVRVDYKESWVLKNWYFWTEVLEKTLESPLDSKEIQSMHPKGNQSLIFFGRTDAETETPILWPPDEKSSLIWKIPWCWGRLKIGGEGDDRGWDGWVASPTQWTWVWVNSGSWLWTGRLGVLWSMGSQSQTRLSDWTELRG